MSTQSTLFSFTHFGNKRSLDQGDGDERSIYFPNITLSKRKTLSDEQVKLFDVDGVVVVIVRFAFESFDYRFGKRAVPPFGFLDAEFLARGRGHHHHPAFGMDQFPQRLGHVVLIDALETAACAGDAAAVAGIGQKDDFGGQAGQHILKIEP